MDHYSDAIKSFIDGINFQAKIDTAIDKLLESNFSKEEQVLCLETLEECLRLSKPNFAIAVIFDKAKEVSNIIKRDDTEPLSKFRKLIYFLLSTKKESISSYMETNFLKKNSLDQFFVLLEEEVKLKIDTSSAEDAFLKLIQIQNFNYLSIERFLKILSKDKLWLVHKLLSLDSFQSVVNQIHETGSQDKEKLKDIAEAIASYSEYSSTMQYARLSVFILQYTNKFIDTLLKQKNINHYILEGALVAEQRTLSIKNYSDYIYNLSPDKFYSFESKLIDGDNIAPNTLLEYANNVSFSSKRLVLKKLVNMRAEKELVIFINKFPEYRNLLPML